MKRLAGALGLTSFALMTVAAQAPQQTLPSETPATFEPVTGTFDYARRDVMIPMRDGVKLHR